MINKRIGYLDALRGFAIFMIVFMHVEHFCLGITFDKSIWGSIVITFFLPVFFFISGYLAKKEISTPLHKEIWGKAKLLVIPALLFYSFYYCLCKGESFLLLFSSPRWPPRAKREITFFIPALQIRLKIVTFATASK